MNNSFLEVIKTNPVIRTIVSILIVFILYFAFRLSFGDEVLSFAQTNNMSFSSQNTGDILSKVNIPELSIHDQRSSLISNYFENPLLKDSGITTSNPKVLAMQKFLIDYNSPMAMYADVFVTEAQKYGLDWRLVASISGVESSFGNIIPRGTNNAWGWKGGPGGDWSQFPNWGEGVKVITRGLANGYGINMTPYEIERHYCPPCYANPAHAWANGVTKYMYELNYYLKNLDKI